MLKLTGRRATSPEKTSHHPCNHPESVELARAQFLEEQASPNLIQRSPEIRVQRVREQKEFRTSVRSSESDDFRDQDKSKHSAVKTVRSISSSLRSRFKRAFSKPQAGLPAQQLDASRFHFGDGTSAFSEAGNGGFDSYLGEQAVDLRRASLYEDPWHEKIDDDDLGRLLTIAPVNRSESSLSGSSKSRVTSWTNTNTTGSMRETPLERKRLSVIQEDGGPHQPSSSAGMHLGGVDIFRKPLPAPPGQHPDPQRLYSALVKRMNQQSEEREAELERRLDQHREEGQPLQTTPTDQSYQTIRAVRASISAEPSDLERLTVLSAGSGVVDHERTKRTDLLAWNPSEESVYSRKTGSDPDLLYRKCNTSEQTIDSKVETTTADYARAYQLTIKTNPYLDSKVDLDSAEVQEKCEPREKQSASNAFSAHTRQRSIRDIEYHVIPEKDCMKDQTAAATEGKSLKAATHVRENACHGDTPPRKASEQLEDIARDDIEGDGRRKENSGTRMLTPSSKVPKQLCVAKKRFPLLNVKHVSKDNTPVPSQNSSLTRSQSGLLQQVGAEQGQQSCVSKHEKESKIAASLRKISPENVANVLRSTKSLANLNHKKSNKENRHSPHPAIMESDEEEQHAASTPGPAYLAMRSGNSGSGDRKGRRYASKNAHNDSPTDLVKATLSARLSRPFNMDTPELNRPFDSMYLGKRETGFPDSSGRLSTTQANTQTQSHGYNKRRSFERGPGGYGGLGPSPFDGQTAARPEGEEETALPHVPTPENQGRDNTKRLGKSMSTKRMVSNFLRSRRKAGNSGEDDCDANKEEDISNKAVLETPPKSSPLFI
ncbi:hypothetical protein LTS08_007369 [Lithohypha guttulata]|nr:hypothetical protein LTS08_007369 [Lithohypha guttulata]